ncbi:RpiR family transcriptional regulator [Tetzosporium hominis]|uniref:RpiR family transcriptional regulator n=1 Tax=Tetzosporium hominis TaxID=2020506 RepID=A0A264W4V2_9BACL|nr:MurR/RpiR family transcriptional regulator [Tetzosporium hominis]OZS78610.1 RpiR family transcriptional regulator [Tetzosporium hominis]
MKEILQKVENSAGTMSAGQKRLVTLLKENQMTVAFSSATEVGKKAQVSESTVIRWAQKLGYKGFTEFQTHLQQLLTEAHIETGEPPKGASTSIVKNLLDADIQSLHVLKESLDEEQLLQAVDALSRAQRIYVTSNFFDYGLAHSFAHWLDMVQGNTQLLMQGDVQYYQQLSRLTTDDVVLAFAFPRYTKNVNKTLEIAKQQGAKVIVVTDGPHSPATEFADVTFFVQVPSNLSIDSYTAVHALNATLMRFLYVKEHDRMVQNIERVNDMYERQDIFLPPNPKSDTN